MNAKTGALFHKAFGPLTMAAEVLLPNQWTAFHNYNGKEEAVRYGTFFDSQGSFLALPLSEVKVCLD